MNIPMGMVSLCFADGGAGSEAINAVVESCADERVVVAVEDAESVRCSIGSECEIRYTDPKDGRFMGVSCAVESIDQGRLTLRAVTETRSANQRSSFRVSTVCSEMTARVGAFADCPVVDVSAAGICVDVPECMAVGETVSVRINAEGTRVDGRFSVRRVSASKRGAQVGLSADPDDTRLADQLTRLTSAMQREQLRRRSRVAESGSVGAAGPGDRTEDSGAGGVADAGDGDAWVFVPATVLAGQALPGSLVNEEGARVASRGQVLSIDDFRRLSKDGLYASDDWSDERRDRRANQRSVCARRVRVVAMQGKHIVRMRAELTDISRGGVGLRTPMLLRPDDYLVVDFSTSAEPCWVIGKVVHGGIGDGETSCRLGVEFQLGTVQHERVPDSEPEFAQWVSVKSGRGATQNAG